MLHDVIWKREERGKEMERNSEGLPVYNGLYFD